MAGLDSRFHENLLWYVSCRRRRYILCHASVPPLGRDGLRKLVSERRHTEYRGDDTADFSWQIYFHTVMALRRCNHHYRRHFFRIRCQQYNDGTANPGRHHHQQRLPHRKPNSLATSVCNEKRKEQKKMVLIRLCDARTVRTYLTIYGHHAHLQRPP